MTRGQKHLERITKSLPDGVRQLIQAIALVRDAVSILEREGYEPADNDELNECRGALQDASNWLWALVDSELFGKTPYNAGKIVRKA